MSEPSAATSLTLRMARALGMDRAVGFAVLARLWQLVTGPVSQLLIVLNFTETTQGYYYAFSYLLGMQIFVELGLHVVIINVSSHEWSELMLTDGHIGGNRESLSRLVSLGRLMTQWYLVATLLFMAVITTAGILYFEDTVRLRAAAAAVPAEPVRWMAPWLTLVVMTGLQLPLLPLTAILEGCHQLPIVNRIRFWQGVAGTLVVWILMMAGGGLWALSGAAAVRLAGELYLVAIRYRSFFAPFCEPPRFGQIQWSSEILPLQWRIAIQGMLLWCVNGLPGLVIFRFNGEAEAGRLGMTWTILTALQSASLAWIETRRPLFGTLIASGNYAELDRLFYRLTRFSVTLMTIAVAAFTLVVWWIGTRDDWLCDRLSGRLLPIGPTAAFGAAMVLFQFALCTNLYVRAHKRDPFLTASIVSSISLASLELWLGRRYGSQGVALGYLFGIAGIQVPLWTVIWWITRREWHAPGGRTHV